jgi:hypothetical protein
MTILLALLLLFFASNAHAQPTTGGGGGGTITSTSQIQITSCSDNEVLAYQLSGSQWVCSPAAGGSGAILDLGDDGSNESASLGEIATTGDTNSIFTEPSANKLFIDLTKNWPAADTATSAATATSASTADALAANGANCSAGQIPLGVNASGAVEGCYAETTVTLDLADNGSNESTGVTEIATTGDTNSIFTEPSANKLLIDLTKKWPSADTATTATSADSATNANNAQSAVHANTAAALDANGANCAAGEIPMGVDAAGVAEGCYPFTSGASATLTLADTTPAVTMQTQYYTCEDTTTIVDFVDSDGDYSEFSADFSIHITALDTCVLNFAAGNMTGNKGGAWTAAVGDTATCYFSVDNDNWSCMVSDPDGTGAFDQEASTIVKPSSANTEWTRVCGDAGCVAVGSTDGGTTMGFDLDNDQAADCTLVKSGGVVSFTCNNTNFSATPGQSGGNIVFNDFAGTACLTIDPDNGNVTQGANCDLLNFDKSIGSIVNHASITAATLTLSGVDCKGGYVKNGDADALDVTLCDGVSGGGQVVCFEDRAGGIITVDVNDTGETITLADGTALTAGNAIDLAAGIGNGFCIFSDSATAWHVLPGAVGTITNGGAD